MDKLSIQRINEEKWIIGMVHLDALPGTPASVFSIQTIKERALAEGLLLQNSGVDAILIENMHDVPYLKKSVGPEIVACMTAVAVEMRNLIHIPVGIQILAAANLEALAVAQAANLDFIRAEGFVFGHLADEGYIESCAGELLRYRKMIGAELIRIFTDVQKKHSSHAITADLSLKAQVEAADYFRSDGIIITGTSTGKEALTAEVKIARESTNLPVIVGSGVSAENIENYWDIADAFIIGSSIKHDGNWKNQISEERVKLLMKKVLELRRRR